jgi:hypothetical protein
VEQARHVQPCTCGPEMFLCLFCNILPYRYLCARGLCCVLHLGDVAPGSDPPQELLAGKKPVHHEVQSQVQPVQETLFPLAVMPVIPHERADDGVVLLFHMGVVILVIRTGTGEGDVPGNAEAGEMSVHELTPVIRMQGDDALWISTETGCQCSDHIDLCVCAYGPRLSPPGGAVGNSQCPAEVSHGLPSIMPYQVHGQHARDIQRRVHARLNGNPATQRGAPGMTEPVQTIRPPLSCQESPDGGTTHLQEKPPGLVLQMEKPMCLFGSPRRAACLLQEPAPFQKSSSVTDFLVFPAFRYACALTIVSFPRSWNRSSDWTNMLGKYALRIGPTCSGGIVNSMPAALFSSEGSAVFCHPSRTFSHELTEQVHLHCG